MSSSGEKYALDTLQTIINKAIIAWFNKTRSTVIIPPDFSHRPSAHY
jgi:hypothetical protein